MCADDNAFLIINIKSILSIEFNWKIIKISEMIEILTLTQLKNELGVKQQMMVKENSNFSAHE